MTSSAHGSRLVLDDSARARLAALADALMPPEDGMPSAEEADTAGKWLDEVLRLLPENREPLARILERTEDMEPAAALELLEREEPDLWSVITIVLPGAYFLNPKVRDLLGYQGQVARPINPDEPPDYEDLIEAVKQRGPIYRPTPDMSSQVAKSQPTKREE